MSSNYPGRLVHLFLFTTAPLFFASGVKAQFDALPDSNATWMVSFWIGPGYPYEGYFYEYEPVDPDTMIAGEVFKKLLVTGNFGGSGYAGAVRDNGTGQVYFCEPGGTTPALLYDFDVLPGDTVFDVFSGWMEDVLVHEVDTVVFNGRPRKRIGLACPTSPGWSANYWIQGIGGLGGFFFNNVCGSVSGIGSLICMTENDTVQYGMNEGSIGVCDIFLGAETQMIDAGAVAFPNPSDGSFTLNWTGDPVLRCVVRDAGGSELMEVDGTLIDLRGHAPGIYLAEITTAKGVDRVPLILTR